MKDRIDKDLIPALVAGGLDLLPAGGLLGVLGERGARRVIEEWQRNRSWALQRAAERAGLSREDLQQVLEEHPEVIPLLIRTLHAAGMTGQDQTLRLLAAFLGDALADVSRVGEVETLIGAIENLTEHHIKVLEIVSSATSEHAELQGRASDHWTTGLVVGVSAMRPELALAGVQGLLAAGFVSDGGLDGGGATWADLESGGTILVITELGSTVLEMLREVADAHNEEASAT